MRIKKWEKWYWGVVFAIIISLLIWIILREKGFVFINKETGKEKEVSKLYSALLAITIVIPLAWFWFCLRFFFLKTNDFICKHCHKEFGGSFETEKGVCKSCYEKKYNKERL